MKKNRLVVLYIFGLVALEMFRNSDIAQFEAQYCTAYCFISAKTILIILTEITK